MRAPLGRFDSWRRRVLLLRNANRPAPDKVVPTQGFYRAAAGEEEGSPSPALHPLTGMQEEQKVSGMSPV
jgi:hypothetical protein